MPQIKKIKVYGTGHNTIRPFAGRHVLKSLIDNSLCNDLLSIRLLARRVKRTWPARGVYIARELAKSKPNLAIRALDEKYDFLNQEVVPELMQNLQASGKYDYIVKNRNYFLKLNFLDFPQFLIIIDSLLAADQRWEAIQIARAYNFCRCEEFNLEDQYPLLSPANKEGWHNFVSFGEGWHQCEDWGCWGAAIRSRLYLDLTKMSPGVSKVGIPIKLFYSNRQILSISLHTEKGRQEVLALEDVVWLDREMGSVVIDFHVDILFSPNSLKVNDDIRLLGVSLIKSENWCFHTDELSSDLL